MSEPLSILDLVLSASALVQVVMAILLMASMASWVMIFQRVFNLAAARRQALAFESEFWSGKDLKNIYLEMQQDEQHIQPGLRSIFASGFKEFSNAFFGPFK